MQEEERLIDFRRGKKFVQYRDDVRAREKGWNRGHHELCDGDDGFGGDYNLGDEYVGDEFRSDGIR